MEDYNDWYMNHSDQKTSEARAEQPITNAFGFMFNGETVDGTKEGAKKYPDGLAKDFMTNPNSPWKWLGDYILNCTSTISVPKTNQELWEKFKPAFNKFNSLSKDVSLPIDQCGSFTYLSSGTPCLNMLTSEASGWRWLGDYLVDIATKARKTCATNNEFRWNLHAFFNCTDGTVKGNQLVAAANFSVAGQPSAWEPYYKSPNEKRTIDTDLKWREEIHAFFNKTNEVSYENVNKEPVTVVTADYTTLGQSDQENNGENGWFDEWWNATFTDYLITGDPMPKVKRSGYAFAGWYYGIEEGYDCNKRVGVGGYDASQEHNNHLWARWLELCLYEGYVDKDIHSIAEKTKVNHNQELLYYINAQETKKAHKLDIHRKFLSDGVSYSTLVLPFAIPRTSSQSAGDYLKQVTDENGDFVFDPDQGGEMPSILICQEAREISVNGEDMVQLVFEELDVTSKTVSGTEAAVPAYVPFLIKPAKPLTPRLHFWSASVYHRENPYLPFVLNGMQLQPVLSPTVITATSDCPLILVNNNRLAQVSSSGEMLGLRGYFILQPELRNLPVKITMRDNTPSNTENIPTDAMIVEIKKILRNGQVYIIRNGQMYDMMGNLVK